MGLDDTTALTCPRNLLAALRAFLMGGRTRALCSRWLVDGTMVPIRWCCGL